MIRSLMSPLKDFQIKPWVYIHFPTKDRNVDRNPPNPDRPGVGVFGFVHSSNIFTEQSEATSGKFWSCP